MTALKANSVLRGESRWSCEVAEVLENKRRWACVESDALEFAGRLPNDSIDLLICSPPYL